MNTLHHDKIITIEFCSSRIGEHVAKARIEFKELGQVRQGQQIHLQAVFFQETSGCQIHQTVANLRCSFVDPQAFFPLRLGALAHQVALRMQLQVDEFSQLAIAKFAQSLALLVVALIARHRF